MIDIHSHILCGVDDGPKTIEETKALKKGCSTNPVGEKLPTGFFTCKKEKSRL